MFSIFKKNKIENLINFYRDFKIVDDSWCLFNVNKNYISSSPITREIDFLENNQIKQLKIGLHTSKIYQQASLNQKIFYQNEIILNSELKLNFNSLIDEIINHEITYFTKNLNNLAAFNTQNIEIEEKALEWLRVSLKVLTEAIEKEKKSQDTSPAYSFYLGLNPKTNLHEIRIAIFNLDIQLNLLNDSNLRVIIYNDQNNPFGTSKKPALMGDYSLRKREMFNHIIELLKILKPTFHI
jgi:hypothetical protein